MIGASPKDPATELEAQAAGLRRAAQERSDRILKMTRGISQLAQANDRDLTFAASYDAAAKQLREGNIHIFFHGRGFPGDCARAA